MSFCRLGPAALLMLVLFGGASADAQSPSADAPPPMPATCRAPSIVERTSVPSEDVAHLKQVANVYGDCMKAYIAARQAVANVYEAKAKAEVDAGNAAAHQVNDLYAAVQAFAAKHAKD